MASSWIGTLEPHHKRKHAEKKASEAVSGSGGQLPLITLLADDGALMKALTRVLKNEQRVVVRGADDDVDEEATASTQQLGRGKGSGRGKPSSLLPSPASLCSLICEPPQSHYIPNDTGAAGGGTRLVAASRGSLTMPLTMALSVAGCNNISSTGASAARDEAEEGGTAAPTPSRRLPVITALPTIPPPTQFAACGATQQGVVVIAVRSGIDAASLNHEQHSNGGPSAHGVVHIGSDAADYDGGDGGGATAVTRGEVSDTAAIVDVERAMGTAAAAAAGALGIGVGGGGSASYAALPSVAYHQSLSSTFYTTTVNSLLQEAAAIVSVGRFCCPMAGAAGGIAAMASASSSAGGGDGSSWSPDGDEMSPSDGMRCTASSSSSSAAVAESPLPAHLVILNVVSPPPASWCSAAAAPIIPSSLLEHLSAVLERSLRQIEPLYDPTTAVRDEGAVGRNTARMQIFSPSSAAAGGGGGGGGGFSSVKVVSIQDPTPILTSTTGINACADGEGEGRDEDTCADEASMMQQQRGAHSQLGLPLSPFAQELFGDVRHSLHFLWELACAVEGPPQLVAATKVSQPPSRASSSSPCILSILRPSPSVVAARMQALVDLTSVPIPSNLMASLSSSSSPPCSYSGAADGGESAPSPPPPPTHTHCDAAALSEARRMWCELYVRTSVQERFFNYCHSRQSRLTLAMVEEAHAAVLGDCERVCSLVLGCDIGGGAGVGSAQQQFLGAAINVKGRLQEGLARFTAIANHNAAKNGSKQAGGESNVWGTTSISPLLGGGGGAEATEGVRGVFNRIRNDHRTKTVTRHAAKGAEVLISQTSVLALWYKAQVEQHVPHQYRFWFTGHGALIVLGMVLFVVMSFMARRE